MSGPASMVRREKAADKAKRKAQKVEKVEYRVEGGDLLILSGKFAGSYVSELFARGPVERDYVIKHVWFDHDEEAMAIIRSLLCK